MLYVILKLYRTHRRDKEEYGQISSHFGQERRGSMETDIPSLKMEHLDSNYDPSFPFYIQYGRHDREMFLHRHEDFAELVIVLSGSATHEVNHESHPIHKGDVFVISHPQTTHGFRDAVNFRICNIMYDPGVILPSQSDLKTTPGYQSLFVIEPAMIEQKGFASRLTLGSKEYDIIYNLIQHLYFEFNSHPPGYRSMIQSLLVRMFILLSRYHQEDNAAADNPALSIATSVAYMEQHFRIDMSIAELAQMAGLSTRHFRRIFQNIYHMSPIRYLNSLRIQTACQMLAATDLSVTEIAIQCGFSDGNYFSTKFKQATGKSPMAYRKNNRSPIGPV